VPPYMPESAPISIVMLLERHRLSFCIDPSFGLSLKSVAYLAGNQLRVFARGSRYRTFFDDGSYSHWACLALPAS